MPVCPNCREESARRSGGKCPECDTPVMLYDGHWFLQGHESPVEQILMRFEDLKTNLLRERKANEAIRFSIPRNHPMYKRELSIAAKYLKAADYDLDLVLRTLNLLFKDPDYAWRTWGDSLATMWESFVTAMSVARAVREKEEEEAERKRNAYEQAIKREDIFSE